MFNLDQLKPTREAQKLTQQELSARSGVPLATIQKQEQGVRDDVFLSVAAPLASALGVSIEELCSATITSKNVIAKGD